MFSFKLEIQNSFEVLEEETENRTINELWDGFKNSYFETAREVIGLNKTKTKDWMSDDTKKDRRKA